MIRRHLTYANVTSTIALCLALGAGGAYAAGKIGSGNVRNNSLRSDDLKNRVAVKSKDVKKNALTGKEIRETDLSVSALVAASGVDAGECIPPPSISEYETCLSKRLRVRRMSRFVVIVTGEVTGTGAVGDSGASATCQLQVDGQDRGFPLHPGELATNTAGYATNGFARTMVTPPLDKGKHEVILGCHREGSPEVRIDAPSLAIIAVGSH